MIRNIRLISKSMTSRPGYQTIVIHILPNITRSKGNQTMKFGELIEYNTRNIFLKSFVQFIFVVCQVGGCQNISKLIRRPLAFISYKAFLKKRALKLVSLLHFQFLLDFSRKLFLVFSCSECL